MASGCNDTVHKAKDNVAESEDVGWKSVQDYEANPLASESRDEKKITKAEIREDKHDNVKRTRHREFYLQRPKIYVPKMLGSQFLQRLHD